MTLDSATRPMSPSTSAAALAEFDEVLIAAAALRQHQLSTLPSPEGDPVATGQRGALLQTLTDIAGARRRLSEGTYGTCTGCSEPISAERLEFRPWSTACVRCAGR